MRFAFTSFFLVTILYQTAFAFDVPAKPDGYVNDYANILRIETKQYLEQKLSQFAASTTHEVAVVTIPEIGSRDTIETLSIRIADTWKVGSEKQDNGIIFVIAPNDREARIEVGYGLEGIMPDMVASRILQNEVFPNFKENNYDGGVIAGVEKIMAVISGEVFEETKSSSGGIPSGAIEPLLIFLFFVLTSLAEYLARTRTWWQGGVIGAAIGLVGGTIFFSGTAILTTVGLVALFGLIADFFLSRKGPFKGGSHGGGYGGPVSWGGFGRSSGGGFGGFSGGGFGGGGSSGRW